MNTKPNRTILLVEDDENDVFFFQRAMSKTGMVQPVQVARDGQEAIQYLQGAGKFASRAQFPLPALVVLDLKLPFVMGLDVLKWIRQESGLAPIVIILSASREDADVAAAYRFGANAYLVKPSEVTELDEVALAITRFWLIQNTPPASARLQAAPEVAQERAPDWAGRQGSPVAHARM
jgi:CheY-like chemotaxis protein